MTCLAVLAALIILTGCATDVTTRGTIELHKEWFCKKRDDPDCKFKPRFSERERAAMSDENKIGLAAYKTWIQDHWE